MTIHSSGQTLIDEVTDTQLPEGQLVFWWLGQHSFILKLAGKIIYIDPFLTPMKARCVPALFEPSQCTNADIIIGTHDHADHIDRPVWPALAKASPNAKFIVPELLRESLIHDLNMDVDRFIGVNDGDQFQHNALSITALASAHELLDRDEATGLYPYLGFVIQAEGLTVYHSGDTCIYEGLTTKLRQWQFDLMMLPINGRDAVRLKRNIVGNMTYQEAVDLAGALCTRYVMPTHYDMFEGNLANVDDFTAYLAVKYPAVKAIVPGYGKLTAIGKHC